MVISIVSQVLMFVLPRLSVTWNWNEPAVVLPLMGTKEFQIAGGQLVGSDDLGQSAQ